VEAAPKRRFECASAWHFVVEEVVHIWETNMRMMLKFTLPVEKGNAAFRDGSLARVLESIMTKLNPEAA
jgi:hypothetical protein